MEVIKKGNKTEFSVVELILFPDDSPKTEIIEGPSDLRALFSVGKKIKQLSNVATKNSWTIQGP